MTILLLIAVGCLAFLAGAFWGGRRPLDDDDGPDAPA